MKRFRLSAVAACLFWQCVSFPLLADEPKAKDRTDDPVRKQALEAIEFSSRRYLDGNVHTPWQIIHGVLALRHDFEIKVKGEKVKAIPWIQQGQTYSGRPWVSTTRFGGEFHRYTQPYHFEGHPNQFLAILTLSDLPPDFTFQGRGGPVTVAQMVENAKLTVNDREEITWTLWALSKYVPSDASWRNQHGEYWSMERLVQLQTIADPNDAACGGTHGLFALCRARKFHLESGKPLRGVWLEADQKIKRHIELARALQYSDGTFSCNYFVNQYYERDFGKRLAPTGHTLEFLMAALQDDQLDLDWVRKGVEAVSRDLIEHRTQPVDCGPLYHALSGLVLYSERTEPPKPEIAATEEPKPLPIDDLEIPLVAPRPETPSPTQGTQSAD